MADNTRIRVWDPLVRLVHWALVAGVAVNLWLTEEGGDIHQWVGYALVALIVVRILWGFIGPWSARWRSFWPTVSRLQCARSRQQDRANRHYPYTAGRYHDAGAAWANPRSGTYWLHDGRNGSFLGGWLG